MCVCVREREKQINTRERERACSRVYERGCVWVRKTKRSSVYGRER